MNFNQPAEAGAAREKQTLLSNPLPTSRLWGEGAGPGRDSRVLMDISFPEFRSIAVRRDEPMALEFAAAMRLAL